jgi:hypothetical protein
MNAVKTQETQAICEQLTVSSRLVFPSNPYPRKYIHCVIDDPRDVAQAIQTLQMAGYSDDDIHVMSGPDFAAAIERGYEQRNTLFQSLTHLFFDYDFDRVYTPEAQRGHTILSVRPFSHDHIMKVRDLLIPHHAHLMKYIDTWTFADLVR